MLAEGGKHKRIAILGRTAADVRDVLIEGDSGILAISPPWFMPQYEPSKRRLTWPNGTQATTYSAEEPDILRGPQHHAAIVDELAAHESPDAFIQLKFGLRLGKDVRCAIATTPRPTPIIREILKQSQDGTGATVVTRGSTYENRENLAPEFFSDIVRQYEGTRLGRQELDGEILDDTPGALWNTVLLDRTRVREAPEMARIVVAIDPSVSSSEDSDECGIAVFGKGMDGDGYMLADRSGIMTPNEWASAAIAAFHEFSADVIVAETNNGGDLVGNTILAIDPSVPFRKVTASRGKVARAEPISALSEQGRVHLVGSFARLEEQLCAMTTEGYTGRGSPDRADAMVWGASEVMLGSGTVQAFPDFRAKQRGNHEPANAVHVYQDAELKDWWPRWVSATAGRDSSAHWWVREPSGKLRVYRELAMRDATPEEFGAEIAARCVEESAVNRSIPVWMSAKAFERTGGKCVAAAVYAGIQRKAGEQRAFLFVYDENETQIADATTRLKSIDARLSKMPRGVISVQPLTGKDDDGWDIIREFLRWRSKPGEARPESPDWEYAKQLAGSGDMTAYMDYLRKFAEAGDNPLPILQVHASCKALIQAMSGAVRVSNDEGKLAQNSQAFLLQSLRIGALASREEQAVEPKDSFVGRRLDKLPQGSSPIGRFLAAEKAESDWSRQFQAKPLNFQRLRRGR